MDDSADRVEQAATRIGTVLGERWVIDSLLGIGGMAVVYAATAGNERAAIKVLHPDLSRSQRAVDRFRREGQALRAAIHPAVPRLRGEGTTDDGCPFLVMDLLLGETVEARRRRFGGRLAPAEVVEIALAVLAVLEVVHARGILHRDVKPSNILWLDDGSIRVIDFGIAKTVQGEGEIALTRTGALPGSLAFMSPEHALGVPGELDARSDLWSLGATMFLLLSGRPVHESQTEVEALARSASRAAPSLGSVASELPPVLVAVVDRALAFERQERFADAASMRAALLDPSSAHGPARARARLVRSPRRWRAALVALGLLGAGSVVVLATKQRPAIEVSPAVASAPAQVTVMPTASLPTVPALGAAAEPVATASPTTPSVRRVERIRPRANLDGAHDAASPLPTASAADASAPARPRCDPPFVIDPETGTRRVKPGC